MTSPFTRSWAAAIVLSSTLAALPALADTQAPHKSGTSPAVAPVSRAAPKRIVRPGASAPQPILVADASDTARTRSPIMMILGVSY